MLHEGCTGDPRCGEKSLRRQRDGDWFLCTYILERIAGALQLHWSCIHHEKSFLLLLLGRCNVLVYTYYVPLSLTGACAFFLFKKKACLEKFETIVVGNTYVMYTR